MPPLKNPRREKFAELIAKGKTSREAYVLAGYTGEDGADSSASQIRNNLKVRARIDELMWMAAEEAGVTIANTLQSLVQTRQQALNAEEILNHEGFATGKFEFDSSGANKANELIGKHLGMFKERHELTGKDGKAIQVVGMSWEDIALREHSPAAEKKPEDEDDDAD